MGRPGWGVIAETGVTVVGAERGVGTKSEGRGPKVWAISRATERYQSMRGRGGEVEEADRLGRRRRIVIHWGPQPFGQPASPAF